MPIIELKRDAEISFRLTSDQEALLARAASLETNDDVKRFVLEAALKAAKNALIVDEMCALLRRSNSGKTRTSLKKT